jgi:hypothetical protein
VEWDLSGSGQFVAESGIDGTQTALRLSKRHRFDAPGVYFVTARVTAHRRGEVAATSCRVVNVASARIIVS